MGTKGTWPRKVDQSKYDKNFPFPDRLFKKEVYDALVLSELSRVRYGIVDIETAIHSIEALSNHFGVQVPVVDGMGFDEVCQVCWDAFRNK